MVSTEVMARGMDFRGVREVINYDFPRSVQSYVHRIGRSAYSVSLLPRELCSDIYFRSYWPCRSRRKGSNLFHRRGRALFEGVSRCFSLRFYSQEIP